MSLNTTPATAPAGAAALTAAFWNTEVRDVATGIQAAWSAWTPSFTGLVVGDGTVVARFHQIGKTITYRLMFTAGTTSTFSASFTFSLPVAIKSDYAAGLDGIGSAFFVDGASAASRTNGGVYVASAGSSLAGLVVDRLGGTYATSAVVNDTTPWTWANTDSFSATGTYEAA